MFCSQIHVPADALRGRYLRIGEELMKLMENSQRHIDNVKGRQETCLPQKMG